MKLAQKLKFLDQQLRKPGLHPFKQQKQFMAWVTEWLGGTTVSTLIPPTTVTSTGSTTSAAAVNLAGMTGQVLVIVQAKLSATSGSSVQAYSNATNAVSGGTSFGSAFAVHTSTSGTFIDTAELNMESFPAQYLYATMTISGTAASCQFSACALQINKIV